MMKPAYTPQEKFIARPDSLALPMIIVVAVFVGLFSVVALNFAEALLLAPLGVLILLLATSRPFWVVLLLALFMPFESFVLKFLPVSDQMYFVSQFLSEFMIYITFFILATKKIITGKTFVRTPIDVPLLVFISVTAISIAINRAPVEGSLLNLRPFLRYIVLYYLVVNLDINPEHVSTITRIVILIAVVQMLIGAVQIVGKGAINEILLPRPNTVTVFGQTREFTLVSRGREIGSVFGTLGDTIHLGLFMLICLIVYLGRQERIKIHSAMFVAAILIAILYSYSRASFMAGLIAILGFFLLRAGLKRVLMISFFPGLLGLIVVGWIVGIGLSINPRVGSGEFTEPTYSSQTITENIVNVFSTGYLRLARGNRIAALVETAPTVLANKPFFGYGYDMEHAVEGLNSARKSYIETPFNEWRKLHFEDVYWVALLTYTGLLGVGVFVLLLFRLNSFARRVIRDRRSDYRTREIALSVAVVTLITPLLLFFNQTLKFRVYSFYFWLLAGLMVASYAHDQRKENDVELTSSLLQ